MYKFSSNLEENSYVHHSLIPINLFMTVNIEWTHKCQFFVILVSSVFKAEESGEKCTLLLCRIDMKVDGGMVKIDMKEK